MSGTCLPSAAPGCWYGSTPGRPSAGSTRGCRCSVTTSTWAGGRPRPATGSSWRPDAVIFHAEAASRGVRAISSTAPASAPGRPPSGRPHAARELPGRGATARLRPAAPGLPAASRGLPAGQAAPCGLGRGGRRSSVRSAAPDRCCPLGGGDGTCGRSAPSASAGCCHPGGRRTRTASTPCSAGSAETLRQARAALAPSTRPPRVVGTTRRGSSRVRFPTRRSTCRAATVRLRAVMRHPLLSLTALLTVAGLVASRGLWGAGFLQGGALLPAPGGAGDWWRLFVEGRHPRRARLGPRRRRRTSPCSPFLGRSCSARRGWSSTW